MGVLENIERLNTLLEEVKSHCMCADFQDLGGVYRVIYPEGMKIDGVQASHSIGKAEALNRMLVHMDQCWIDSGIV